jgi:eukaryotic-like serine/threonine-protein kinase
MRPIRTAQQFVDALRRFALVDAPALKEFVATFTSARDAEVNRIAERATEAGLLTTFQAREVMAGRGEQLNLGEYRLTEKLGSGGMGDVFLGVHNRSGVRRAIKVLAAALQYDQVARLRLEREGLTAFGLNHPNIVRVHEFDCAGKVRPPYLVMEFVDGVSLQAAVALTGTFTAEAAAACGRQVADGLQHAWDARLVHRDIKPANLLLDRSGVVKVLDLGIVRWADHAGLTTVGRDGKCILGTVDYLAPEQAVDSSTVDCRADVYSLGATLYFLLAGHPPHIDGNPAERLLLKQRQDPTPIHHLRPDVPVGLSEVIGRMLSRRAEDRYAIPVEVVDALTPWVGTQHDFTTELFARISRAVQSNASETESRESDGPATPVTVAGATVGVNDAVAVAELKRIQQTPARIANEDVDTPLPTTQIIAVRALDRQAAVSQVGRSIKLCAMAVVAGLLIAALIVALRW